MNKKRATRRRRAPKGFTLLETLLVSLLVAALSVAVLQSLALSLQVRELTGDRWRSTLRLWNRAVEVRRDATIEGRSFRPTPSARPIQLILIEGEDPRRPGPWEVLRAEK